MLNKLEWFTSRIGTRVYRGPSTCQCDTCKDVVANGLVIQDEFHAEYLHSIQNDMLIEYRENKNTS